MKKLLAMVHCLLVPVFTLRRRIPKLLVVPMIIYTDSAAQKYCDENGFPYVLAEE